MAELNLVIPFTFRYPFQGQLLEMVLNPSGEWIPILPITQCMCLDRKVQMRVIQSKFEYELVKHIGMKHPAVSMTLQTLKDYLNNINANRAKYPELVRYFKTQLPSALEAYYEQIKAVQQKPAPAPELETQLAEPFEPCVSRSVEEAEEWLRNNVDWSHTSNPEIVINRPLTSQDKIRKDLVMIGLSDYDEINFICNQPIIKLLKRNTNPELPPRVRTLYQHARYEQGYLYKLARDEKFYPEPEFYRQYPEYYEIDYIRWTELQRGAEVPVVKNGRLFHVREIKGVTETYRPTTQAPWFTEEFEELISLRKKRAFEAHKAAVMRSLERGQYPTTEYGGLAA